MENSWQAIIEKNEEGEVFLPIKADLIKKYGWSIQDELELQIREDHIIVINVTQKMRENENGFG